MKYGVVIASTAAVALVLGRAGAVFAGSPGLDPIFVPAVHADDTFRYSEVDRLTGAIKHTHTSTTIYRVLSSQNGVVRYQREVAGKGKTDFERDAIGNVNEDKNARAGVPFFFPRQLLGDAPNPIAAGLSWQVRIPVETSLGFPGTATISVVSVDPGTKHIVLRASLRGEGEVSDMTPGDNTPTRFHTWTNRHATIELTNGIVDSHVVVGDDKQSANQSEPINVHVEITSKRIK